jgi:6-phosphogluconolactonase (cycloisomerase 2 family)
MARRRSPLKVALAAGTLLALLCATVSFAATGSITFVKEYAQGQHGIDGLASTNDVNVSGDGKNVYALGANGGLVTFDRDKVTGKLSFVNVKPVNGGENVVVSPDGRSVYVSFDDDFLKVFERNPGSGKLSLVQTVRNDHHGVTGMVAAWAIVVSGDNENVYVSDNSTTGGVVTFKRDRQTGKLKFLNDRPDGGSGGDSAAESEGIAISPKGDSVYLTSPNENAVTTFKRNPKSGSLKFVDSKIDGSAGVTDLLGAYEPVVSSDGKNVYVSAYLSNAIVTFKRDKQTGKLTFREAITDSGEIPIPEPLDEVVSADGKNVYVACYDHGVASGLSAFKRDPQSGKLKFRKILRDGSDGVTAAGLWRVAISPDDRSLYTADYDGGSVALFKRSK